MTKRKLSLREFAVERGLCLTSVYQRIWAGRLPGAKKVNGKWEIEVVDNEPKKQELATR